VVFVAVPPAALSEVAADLKDYTGVVVSVIVPGVTLAQEGASAAEQLAELLPKERGYGVHPAAPGRWGAGNRASG
jgi:predicted dinucleotide-binding enzyme